MIIAIDRIVRAMDTGFGIRIVVEADVAIRINRNFGML